MRARYNAGRRKSVLGWTLGVLDIVIMAGGKDLEGLMLEQMGLELNKQFLSTIPKLEDAINEGDSAKLSEALKDAVKQDTFDPDGGSSVKRYLNSGVEILDAEQVGKKIRFDFNVVLPKEGMRGKQGGTTDVGEAITYKQ